MAKRASIKRPWLLGVAAGGVAAAAGAAFWSLAQLGALLDAKPITLVTAAADLEPALRQGPWLPATEQPEAPTLWVLVGPSCADCTAFIAGPLAALEREALDVRVIFAAPRTSPLAPQAGPLVAAVAKDGDYSLIAAWRSADFAWTFPGAPPAPQDADAAAEVEGFVEWGAATYDRLDAIVTRNEAQMAPIALFWRRGVEWRVALGGDPRTVPLILDELLPDDPPRLVRRDGAGD